MRRAHLADTITDFSQAEHEKIQLNLVDADVNTAGNQAFAFARHRCLHRHRRRAALRGGRRQHLVVADTNGDGAADWHIGLTGVHALVAVDFVL